MQKERAGPRVAEDVAEAGHASQPASEKRKTGEGLCKRLGVGGQQARMARTGEPVQRGRVPTGKWEAFSFLSQGS